MSAARALRNLRIAAVSSVVALLALAHAQGLLQRFGDPQGLARTLVDLGPWGYAAFIGAYTLLQPFGVPGTVFIVAAPLIWPWPVAFGLSMVGTMCASVVGFSFATPLRVHASEDKPRRSDSVARRVSASPTHPRCSKCGADMPAESTVNKPVWCCIRCGNETPRTELRPRQRGRVLSE